MNPTVTTEPGRQSHPPQQSLDYTPRRVGTLDRLALHLGVALITWGRRPSATPTRERRANRFEQNLLRLERERRWERDYRLAVR